MLAELPPVVTNCLEGRAKRVRFPRNATPKARSRIESDFELARKARQVFPRNRGFSPWVLTRLHTRYSKETLSEDLVFGPVKPVVGGRGSAGASREPAGAVQMSSVNQFQGRYIMRNYWSGAVKCDNPKWGRWGGPPGGKTNQIRAATKLASAKRGAISLPKLVRSALPQWNLPGKSAPKR